MAESTRELQIPGSSDVIRPGYHVKLGRFDTMIWTVGFGWYSSSGNRPCCGWYLTSNNGSTTKPLQLPDLTDIYLIDMCPIHEDPERPIQEIDAEIEDARIGEDGTVYDSLGEAIREQIRELKESQKIIPIADVDVPGLIKAGNGLDVADDGLVSAHVYEDDEYAELNDTTFISKGVLDRVMTTLQNKVKELEDIVESTELRFDFVDPDSEGDEDTHIGGDDNE